MLLNIIYGELPNDSVLHVQYIFKVFEKNHIFKTNPYTNVHSVQIHIFKINKLWFQH